MKAQLNKNSIFSILFILFSLSLRAQHCKYDFLGLIGIVPYIGDTNKIVDGLYITLTDSLGNPIMQSQPIYNKKSHLIKIKKQNLNSMSKKQKGFTVVEWGGLSLPKSYSLDL